MSALTDFYRGVGGDAANRRFDDVLGRDFEWLERTHDYIQWLFPLDVSSAFNPDAPLLTAEDRREFAASPELAANLNRAFRRMLDFYGFVVAGTRPRLQLARGDSFERRRLTWLTAGNHNLLRISRILSSLRLLGHPELAEAFFDALERLYQEDAAARHAIGERSFAFWKRAALD